MHPEEFAKRRIAFISKELHKYNRLYYVEGISEISDYDYDMLLKKLEALEKEWPQFALPDSPTKCVGGFLVPDNNEDV